jgi:hypothetical protein
MLFTVYLMIGMTAVPLAVAITPLEKRDCGYGCNIYFDSAVDWVNQSGLNSCAIYTGSSCPSECGGQTYAYVCNYTFVVAGGECLTMPCDFGGEECCVSDKLGFISITK